MDDIISKTKQDMTWNKTGTWRTIRPVLDPELCNECGLCKTFCPDFCIENGNVDYDYCKGCGVCSEECPKKAIKMVEED